MSMRLDSLGRAGVTGRAGKPGIDCRIPGLISASYILHIVVGREGEVVP